jgi:subtilisin
MNIFPRVPRFNVASLVGAACALLFAHSALAIQVIVDVFDGVSPAAVAARYKIVPEQVFTEVANAFTADITARQIAQLEADPDVQQVARDGVAGRIPRPRIRVSPPGPITPPQFRLAQPDGAGPPPASIPGQPAQFVTAAMRRVKVPLSATADVDGLDDRRVDADIAILDGGVDPYHPDLNVAGGHDCVRGPAAERGYYDRDGHGTFVAGMAAAIDNGIGLVGVAPGARIWAVRVSNFFGEVTDSALLCGLEYSAKNRKIQVVNLSLGGQNPVGPCRDESRGGPRVKSGGPQRDRIHQSICRLVKRGVTVVAAAGNSSADAASFTPAAYEEVITVSGIADFDGLPGGLTLVNPPVCFHTERDDHFATFSNYGSVVDIAAPAVCVTSTIHGGNYAVAEGTSFAAPMVSGAAALLYARRPNISPAQVKQLIIAHAEPGPIPGDPDAFPEGILNVSAF